MKIIYFDGVCILCHWFVQFVIRNDPQNHFYFKELQNHKDLSIKQDFSLKSVVLEISGRSYTESEAIDLILKNLRFPFFLIPYLTFFIPRLLKNQVYQWISDHRYQFWGKYETCQRPRDVDQKRFLN